MAESKIDHDWVICTQGSLPSQPVVAGRDSDGDTIYIGRVMHAGDLLPAKVVPGKGKAYVCYSGNEIELEDYEVLNGLHYDWLPAANGDVPPGAVKIGRSADGEMLYAGRGSYEGSLSLGKVHPSHGCLYIPYGGEEVRLTEYAVLVAPDRWLDASADSLPDGAVQGGTDADGDPIYVGRVFKEGDMIPAKIIPNKGGAFASWGGNEHKVAYFQVLVGKGFRWLPAAGGDVLPGAIAAGSTVDGETLYVGRAHHNGSLCVGKVHPSNGCLYLPFGGDEVSVGNYEMLVRI